MAKQTSKIVTKRDLDLVIESTLKEVGLVHENEPCPTCGDTVCECGTSYMDEEVTEEVTEDVVEASISGLSESINNTTNSKFLKEEMDNFNKLINYSK